MVKRVNKNIKKNNNLLKKKKPKKSEDKKLKKEEELSEKIENEKIENEKEENEKEENEKEESEEENTEIKEQQNEIENLDEIMNKNSNLNTGVIYIGHLPWGFEENALKKYFNQFGEITRLIVPRSKKSGRTHGYAFIEFKNYEVAEIAANTMNNYLLFDRILKCNIIEEKSKYDRIFRKWKKKFEFENKYKKYIENQNKKKSNEEIKNQIQLLLEREENKREKLKDLKINYNFDGYKKIVEDFKKKYNKKKRKNK